MLAELFFQRVKISGGLVDIILRANNADTPRRLTQQRLRNDVGPIIQLIHRFQYGLTAGFLHAARPAQHP
ncbi:hypothetical protein D3C76_1333810 [compost metagenome]